MKRTIYCLQKKHGAAIALILFLILLFNTASIRGAGLNDETDTEEENRPDSSPINFSLTGYVEFENYISTYADQEFSDAIKKNELRSRFDVSVGTDAFYLFATPDIYLNLSIFDGEAENDYASQGDLQTAADLRFSYDSTEFIFRQLYLNFSAGDIRLRLGNQIYGWGTADTFNPTAYFNAYDLREFVFRGEDEFRSGSPSLSGMFFFEEATLEAVISLHHHPLLLAPEGSFWAITTSSPLYTILIETTDREEAGLDKPGFGARLSMNIFDSDVSFSGYHGPDKEPVFVPWSIELVPNTNIIVLAKPQHFVVNYMGVDFSKALGDFVIQFEAAYSPDKSGLVIQDIGNPSQVQLPFEVRNASYIAYAAGFNYFVPLYKLLEGHEGESIFTLDYSSSTYFDDDLLSPLLSNLLTLRYDDSFFDSRVTASLTAVTHVQSRGTIIWPKIGYNFQNGLLLELSFAFIDGNPDDDEEIDPVFYTFRNNDILMWKVRYEF
jgi:hypothetical protein